MVYNAMKLFMEINPQLFDECSHDYTELQATADERKAHRQSKWDRLAAQAQQRRGGAAPSSTGGLHNGAAASDAATPRAAAVHPPPRIDEDPATQDSQKRLDALKLQDERRDGRAQRSGSGSGDARARHGGAAGGEGQAGW